MNVLIACEFSGTVREAFKARGHNAVSCDLLPTEIEGKHYQGDLFDILGGDWHLVIAHPPCTAIAVSGNRYYAGTQEREDAVHFVNRIWATYAGPLCIENPVGVLNTYIPDFPKPQYIQPWMFGHDASKKTGLWKRYLPDLVPTNIITKDRYANQTPSGPNNLGPSVDRWKLRSRTYQGIADAMASQWG